MYTTSTSSRSPENQVHLRCAAKRYKSRHLSLQYILIRLSERFVGKQSVHTVQPSISVRCQNCTVPARRVRTRNRCTGEGTGEREGSPPPTCAAGHTLTFARRRPPSGDGLKCDGECGRRIHEGVWRYSCETCDADWCASCERTSSEGRASKRTRRGGEPGGRERTPTAQVKRKAPGGGQAGEPAMARARRAVRSTESPRPSAGTGDARGPHKRGPPTAEPPDPAPFQGGSRQRV